MDSLPSDPFKEKIDEVLNTVKTYQKEKPILPLEVGSIIIYGHTLLETREYFYKSISLQSTHHISRATFEDMEYRFSDLHFEMSLTQTTIGFIKSTSKNRSINGKPFIFYIFGFDNANKMLQNAMKRLIDTCLTNCVFVFAVETLSNVDRGIINRSCIVNLVKNSTCHELLLVDKSIHQFLQKSRNLKPVDILSQSREFAYKLFHVNCPLSRICKAIIDYFSDDETVIVKLVEDLARLEAHSHKVHKDIFVYEQVILLATHKYIPIANVKPKKRTTSTKRQEPRPDTSIASELSIKLNIQEESKELTKPEEPPKKKINIKLANRKSVL